MYAPSTRCCLVLPGGIRTEGYVLEYLGNNSCAVAVPHGGAFTSGADTSGTIVVGDTECPFAVIRAATQHLLYSGKSAGKGLSSAGPLEAPEAKES